ncbi:chorismate-binding protein [Psychroserpens algicola]|uniref:chorismate-binding protein n=1 Tax=Psychroserpens algicola TaxID=1719034 RepID=UPI001954DC39|nr:chorismate-binding protein [Psychroserpens algicola]
MHQKDVLGRIENQFISGLPFVAYRKPNASTIHAMLQKNDDVHIVVDFTESGFVFSPFDSELETIIFPEKLCETIQSELDEKTEKSTNLSPNPVTQISQDNDDLRYQHIELIQKGIDTISNSDLKKIVVSRIETVPISEDNPIRLFKSLLEAYPTAFVYIWYHPKVGLWLGASPETLLHIEGLRFKTMALAGTQLYQNSMEVEWDSKNIEEQHLVTQYIEHKLMPHVSQISAVPAQTIKAGQLLHLQSKISGILKSEHLKEVIFSLHPTPAVCGLPEHEAKQFILSNENYDREFYTGFLGELNLTSLKTRNSNRRNVENNAYGTVKKSSHLFVNLRCMQIKNQKALVYVGGGITKDSKPQNEWEETVNKSYTMKSVIS